MTRTSVTVAHNFETGHRLPHLPGKCQNLHGHSWWTEVTVTAPGTPSLVVDFGAMKKELRAWIDRNLDHGLMLGDEDPLRALLENYGKVFRFLPERGAWPTVENVAALIADVADTILTELPRAADAYVSRVVVRETAVNSAEWTSK